MTPSYVAFTNIEHLIKDTTKNHVAQNIVFDAKRLIGRCLSNAFMESNMKLWPFKVFPIFEETYKRLKSIGIWFPRHGNESADLIFSFELSLTSPPFAILDVHIPMPSLINNKGNKMCFVLKAVSYHNTKNRRCLL